MELIQSIITIVLFFLILGVLVLVHEVGHYVIARLAGVRVLEFGIGFPPRARVLRSEGETLWTLNWLPIGGFVKLEGEDGDVPDDPRSFSRAPLAIRLLILVAGVAMNVVLAFVIFTGIAWTGDPTIGIRAGTVDPTSPAAAGGIVAGDVVVSVDGRYFSAFEGESLLGALRDRAGETVTIGLERDGLTRDVVVTLRPDAEISPQRGALGIGDLTATTTSVAIGHDLPEAAALGLARTAGAMGVILGGLGELGAAILNPTEPPPASGPVGIALQIGDVFWTLGPIVTLFLAGVLSANLAIVNILPLPPLDGGRILVIGLKSAFGERLSLRVERMTYLVGFVFLFAFLIWITGFDLIRQLGG